MRIRLTLAALACAAGCSLVAPDGNTVASGMWAGDHVALDVGGAGAQVTFDCAHGTIDQPMTLDASSNFDTPGTFTTDGGPTPETQTARPARYRGHVSGSTMTLAIVLTDRNESAGEFSLAKGGNVRLTRCK